MVSEQAIARSFESLANDARSVLDKAGGGALCIYLRGEPVVVGGPYVMNTQDEIDQANIDFAAGKFDNVTLASAVAVDKPNWSVAQSLG